MIIAFKLVVFPLIVTSSILLISVPVVFDSPDSWSDTVMANWSKRLLGKNLSKIMGKLSRLKHYLKGFSRKKFGDFARNYQLAKDDYITAQICIASSPIDIAFYVEEQASKELFATTHKRYANYMQQLSKIIWLHYGDDNSKFFYASINKRKEANRITTYMVDGVVIED
ncbi:hypothetical protein G4B88_011371 [Cannabis sativa]|uniref:Photosystem II reaction center protein Z n=1 Tax=Cannabis sativa TaxID=3483 RepID=A0A7J6GJT7_CANSA|nr:hypothetical protein G4B88_011371 [Cannabis sativa]